MQFQIIITPSAKADIFETNTWLLENHLDTANSWLWEISKAVSSLSKFPTRCQISQESEAFDVEVRQLIFGKKPHIYRILFSIQNEIIYILRVRSTKQKNLLDE